MNLCTNLHNNHGSARCWGQSGNLEGVNEVHDPLIHLWGHGFLEGVLALLLPLARQWFLRLESLLFAGHLSVVQKVVTEIGNRGGDSANKFGRGSAIFPMSIEEDCWIVIVPCCFIWHLEDTYITRETKYFCYGPTISCKSSVLLFSIHCIASSLFLHTCGWPLSFSSGLDIDPSNVISKLHRMLFRRYSKQCVAWFGLSSSVRPLTINWW